MQEILRSKVHTAKQTKERQHQMWCFALTTWASSRLNGLRGIGRHVSICHCGGKAQTPISPAYLGLYWDVLAAARTGVRRTGQSGDDTGFEGQSICNGMAKAPALSSTQCTLTAPGRWDPRRRASEKVKWRISQLDKCQDTSVARAVCMVK